MTIERKQLAHRQITILERKCNRLNEELSHHSTDVTELRSQVSEINDILIATVGWLKELMVDKIDPK